MPPGPTTVVRRFAKTVPARSLISFDRPKNGVNCTGRFRFDPPVLRSGANDVVDPSALNCHTCSGSVRSRKRCSPRFTSVACNRGPSTSKALAVDETRICPPCPIPRRRAARFSPGSNQSSPRVRRHPHELPSSPAKSRRVTSPPQGALLARREPNWRQRPRTASTRVFHRPYV